MNKIKVAVNGNGVIGKRVADAFILQDDMELSGVCDVSADWRIRVAAANKFDVYAFDDASGERMKNEGVDIQGEIR